MNKQLITTLALVGAATSTMAMLDITLPGTNVESSWTTLNAETYGNPNYPVFPTNAYTDPFLAPISAQNGDTTAEFTKTSGGGVFLPEDDGGGTYNLFTPGSWTVYDTSAIADLATVVFQVEANAELLPTLNYNSGAQALSADFSHVGTDFFAYQWDLSGIGDDITSFEINWGPSGAHYSISGLQLNQGDTFAQVVPEPRTYALIAGLACGALILMRRQRR
ncbi:PEP-CTERM sorting domain-containing protein [Cerasicoccus maritimus]|uniref:PEP-CTERM sorting domain-containing protein n=1 Tax=Cerasicoccus maritimus TaxID=490089 RepID=UPI0028525B30|nr:PEP-CTERM sorting domain-containing protein [Cerasicoccus maritimus]